MGADVVKIERPGSGDVIRGWDRAVRGLASGYVWLNRAKRSVTVDAKHASGRAILQRIADRSDVFLTNMGPGAPERVGLGYEELSTRNPRLIYCNVSGYGATGPYRDVKAYDLMLQGEAGILATTGYPGKPAKVGIPICDIAAGSHAALAIVMALYQRERTGRGQLLDISMFESTLAWLAYYPHHYWHHREEPTYVGMRHHYIVPYGPYETSDGRWVITGVSTPQDWQRMCREVFDRPDLLEEERFRDSPARRQHRAELEAIVEALFLTRPCEDWVERLMAAALPCGILRGIGDVLAHPQVEPRGLVREVDSPVGRVPTIESALRMSDSPPARGPIPGLGQHTEEVLHEVGFSPADIERFRTEGAI
jgi:crotonobetainyl-CoA:carnitine CoA-transferase CaiB-like acyl-CoA transferase